MVGFSNISNASIISVALELFSPKITIFANSSTILGILETTIDSSLIITHSLSANSSLSAKIHSSRTFHPLSLQYSSLYPLFILIESTLILFTFLSNKSSTYSNGRKRMTKAMIKRKLIFMIEKSHTTIEIKVVKISKLRNKLTTPLIMREVESFSTV